jgi:hypothetical protein
MPLWKITDKGPSKVKETMNRFPGPLLTGVMPDYDAFLDQRHNLMAAKIKTNIRTEQTHGASD